MPQPRALALLALSVLPGCFSAPSTSSIPIPLGLQSEVIAAPRALAKAHRQTIFIDDGSSHVDLFRGYGKGPDPYKRLPGGGAVELTVDSSGTLYDPSDSFPGYVDEYAPPYGKLKRTITDGIRGVQGIAAASDGTLYVSNLNDVGGAHSYISVYAPGQVHAARRIRNSLYGPMAVDSKGRLFVEDEGFGFIDYYEKGSSKFQMADFQGYSEPNGIAADRRGNYYISNLGAFSNDVLEYGPTGPEGGPITRTITSDGEPYSFRPAGLAVDNRGDLYVADQGNHGVAVYAPGATTTYAFIPYGEASVAVTHSL